MFRVLLHPVAHKELEALDPASRDAIKKKLRELEQFPERGKHLRHSPFRTLRVGDYRAVYEVVHREQKVIVLYIGHRKHVYDDLSRAF